MTQHVRLIQTSRIRDLVVRPALKQSQSEFISERDATLRPIILQVRPLSGDWWWWCQSIMSYDYYVFSCCIKSTWRVSGAQQSLSGGWEALWNTLQLIFVLKFLLLWRCCGVLWFVFLSLSHFLLFPLHILFAIERIITIHTLRRHELISIAHCSKFTVRPKSGHLSMSRTAEGWDAFVHRHEAARRGLTSLTGPWNIFADCDGIAGQRVC